MPVIVFAHGYQQVVPDYHDLWEALVPKGYAVVLPTTEAGGSIDADAFAGDVAFLAKMFTGPSGGDSTPVAGRLSGKIALMGHSTGGGACYLAQSSVNADTHVTFAALGQLYGPITGTRQPFEAATSITTPGLVLAGEKDCICPVEEHQQPVYQNLNAATKAFVVITSGDHCGFSDSNNCPVAEALACGLFGQGQTLDDDRQMAMVLEYTTAWLDYFLRDDMAAWNRFRSLAAESQGVSIEFLEGAPSAPAISGQVDEGTLSLWWKSVPGALDYRLFYAPYPEAAPIHFLDLGNATRFSCNLPRGASYYAAVKARNSAGYSDYSNILLINHDNMKIIGRMLKH